MKQSYPKIIFCDVSLNGQLNFRGDIIKQYASQGYQVTLLSPPDIDYNWDEKDVKYVPIQLKRSSMNPLHDLRYFITLYKLYKKEKPNYIFHYSIKANIYGTIAARLLHIRSTAMIAGLGFVFYQKGLKCSLARKLYKFALHFSEYVFVLNSANKELLIKTKIVNSKQLIHLIGGEGVNLDKFVPLNKVASDKNKIVFLMISRPIYDKGYKEYVEAAHQIKERYSNVEFQLLGPIDEAFPRHVSKEQIQNDHASGNINYLGFTLNVIPTIKQCDCIVLPSYYNEGLSRSLMEAIAMGKPVITTNMPGCKETVDNGKNGFIVLPKSVESLVEAFEQFIKLSVEQRIMMGKYSREKAEKEFDIKKVIEVYNKITNTIP